MALCFAFWPHLTGWRGRGLPAHPLAQLRQTAVRNHLCGDIILPHAPAHASRDDGRDIGSDPGIPLGDALVPAHSGQPCPPGIAAIRLAIAEFARIERLARQHAAGLITRARLAFCLRWSRCGAAIKPTPGGTTTAPGSGCGIHLTLGDRER